MDDNNAKDRTTTAEELLLAANSGSGKGGELSSAAEAGGGAYAILLGIMLGMFLLAVEYVFPAGIIWQILAVTALYLVGVFVITRWYFHRRRAISRGWARRYRSAFTASISFYAAGIALSVLSELSSPVFWVPYAAWTAAPLILVRFRKEWR